MLEGKYWRRKIEAVAEEYHKWRKWYWRKGQQQAQLREARQPEVAAGPSLVNDMTLWDLNLGGWDPAGLSRVRPDWGWTGMKV